MIKKLANRGHEHVFRLIQKKIQVPNVVQTISLTFSSVNTDQQ